MATLIVLPSDQWPDDRFTVAPVWKKDVGSLEGLNVFSTYAEALALAELMRVNGTPCVIRRGGTVYRDGFTPRAV